MKPSDKINATTYRCFISYRHADNHDAGRRWATWLHQRLEKYPVPPSLVGTANLRGQPVPRSIFPVFRDEEELPADADLSTPILRALDHSLGMIVICSPRARASRFVDDEVRLFKRASRGERILGMIIAGTPDTAGLGDDNSFPRAYLHQTTQAGEVLAEPEIPLNLVDLRTHDGQEGWTDANHHREALDAAGTEDVEASVEVDGFTSHLEEQFLVLVAHVLEVPAATLAEHHHRHQAELRRARRRSLLLWGGGATLLALAAWQGIRISMEQGDAADVAAKAAEVQSQATLERKTQRDAEEVRTRRVQAETDYAQAVAQQSLPNYSLAFVESKFRSAAELGHAAAQVALGQRLLGQTGGDAEAIRWFTEAAKQAYPPAMEAMGVAYRDGRGVEKDQGQAERWLRQAAETKLSSAQFELGRLLSQSGNATEARRWLETAAQGGHPGAQFELGRLLLGSASGPEATAGQRWLKAAAEQGLAPAQRELGRALARGQGMDADILQALRWLLAAEGKGDQEAAQELARIFKDEATIPKARAEALQWHLARATTGNASSQNLVGLAYRDGLDVPVDLNKASDFLEKSAAAGFADAQYNLGELFAKGLSRQHRPTDAFKFKEMAARQGHLQSMHDVAELYFKGFNVPITDPQAAEWARQAGFGTASGEPAGMEWLTKAAEAGHARSGLELGQRLLVKFEKSKDANASAQAQRWLTKAAEQGNAEAQRALGLFLYPTDKPAALGWIRKAAEQGETLGQFTLGIALRDGNGLKANRIEAIHWLGLAAEKGQAEAEVALATLLLDSTTASEQTKGAIWLRKAAEQGFAPAQNQLGEILLTGTVVKPDPKEAYQWLLIAAANPAELSREQRNSQSSRLSAAAGRLTPAQRLEAQQAATLFTPLAPSR
jgi:TPR repeat protein